MHIKPLADRLLVRPIPDPTFCIIIPDKFKPAPRHAKVIAVGPKVKECKVGDVVVLPGVAASEPDHVIDGDIFVREGDVGWIVRNA